MAPFDRRIAAAATLLAVTLLMLVALVRWLDSGPSVRFWISP